MVLVFEDVAAHDRHVGEPVDGLGRQLLHSRVDFDRDDRARPLGQKCGESAGPRTDLENHVVALELRLRDQKLDQVQIDEEVLAQVVPRIDAVASQQLADMRPRLACGLFHVLSNCWTYFPRMSVSILTSSPGLRSPSVVTSSVCGISATLKQSAAISHNRQAHAVDRHRAFGHHLPHERSGSPEPHRHPLARRVRCGRPGPRRRRAPARSGRQDVRQRAEPARDSPLLPRDNRPRFVLESVSLPA